MARGSKKRRQNACLCSHCRRHTHLDEYGIARPGLLHDDRMIARHEAKDRLIERKRKVKDAVVADAVLLATIGVKSNRLDHQADVRNLHR